MQDRSTVSVVRCPSYEPEIVRRTVRDAIGLLGGMERFVSGARTVLVKPNMLSPRPPEKGVTTHPSVVGAVVELAAVAGAKPVIGDSPGFHAFSKVAAASGIGEVAARLGVPLAPFDEEVEVPTAEGCLMKRLTVAREVMDAGAVISVPKFKTHCLTHITCAIKNFFGYVPGLKKAEMHYRFPDNEKFAMMLLDVVRTLPARLHVVDAVTVMDGNGPSYGGLVHMGLIIAGSDPVAVDSTACRIAGLDPLAIPMIRLGEESGVGNASAERIEIVGEPLERVRIHGFQPITPKAEVGRLIPFPEFISRRFKNWIVSRPRFRRDMCTMCGACVKACPARPKALSIKDGGVTIDDRACLLCYCCYEVCPSGAVRLKRGFAAGILARLLKL